MEELNLHSISSQMRNFYRIAWGCFDNFKVCDSFFLLQVLQLGEVASDKILAGSKMGKEILDLPGGQCPVVREMLLSSIPSSNLRLDLAGLLTKRFSRVLNLALHVSNRTTLTCRVVPPGVLLGRVLEFPFYVINRHQFVSSQRYYIPTSFSVLYKYPALLFSPQFFTFAYLGY